MLNFDPQGHDPGRIMILYESSPEEVHIYQFLHFYHKVNDFSAYPLDYRHVLTSHNAGFNIAQCIDGKVLKSVKIILY